MFAYLWTHILDFFYNLVLASCISVAFFLAGRPYFIKNLRIFFAAVVAGVLNGLLVTASVGLPADVIPQKFLAGFLLVGIGVAILEWLFPAHEFDAGETTLPIPRIFIRLLRK